MVRHLVHWLGARHKPITFNLLWVIYNVAIIVQDWWIFWLFMMIGPFWLWFFINHNKLAWIVLSFLDVIVAFGFAIYSIKRIKDVQNR